jgi:hypothetical protein
MAYILRFIEVGSQDFDMNSVDYQVSVHKFSTPFCGMNGH